MRNAGSKAARERRNTQDMSPQRGIEKIAGAAVFHGANPKKQPPAHLQAKSTSREAGKAGLHE